MNRNAIFHPRQHILAPSRYDPVLEVGLVALFGRVCLPFVVLIDQLFQAVVIHEGLKITWRTRLLGEVQVYTNSQGLQRTPSVELSRQFANRADHNLLRSSLAICIGLSPTKDPNQIATLALYPFQTSLLIPCSHLHISLLFGEHGRQRECTRSRIQTSSSDRRNRHTRR